MDTIKPGQYEFVNFDHDSQSEDSPMISRMMDLGFLPGQNIRVVQVLPLGAGVIVQIEGSRYFLRHEEAAILNLKDLAWKE
jgi:Fe2+ transport system protein FeoA